MPGCRLRIGAWTRRGIPRKKSESAVTKCLNARKGVMGNGDNCYIETVQITRKIGIKNCVTRLSQ